MLNYVWIGMLIISFAASFITGNVKEVCAAVTDGAEAAVQLALSMAGIMAFWTGMMKIAEKSGLVSIIVKLSSPFIKLLFPEVRRDKEVCGAIAMNMTANFFGMGNAATPLGIKAMKMLNKYSKNGRATNSMCMLAVVNSASIQLIPSTLIAIRSAYQSRAPSEIIIPIWIVSVVTFSIGVICAKIAEVKS